MNANERKLKAEQFFIISTLSAEIYNYKALHTNAAYENQINICVHLRDAYGCANVASAWMRRRDAFAFSVSFEN